MREALPHDLTELPRRLAELGSGIGSPFHFYSEIGSTNDEAKRAAKLGEPHGALFLADSQTAGRGRQGRAWSSPRGESILASIVVRIPCPLDRLPQLSVVVGLTIADVVRAYLPPARARDVGVKWPNDVLLGGRKLAGILVEAQVSGKNAEAVIVGFGLNVHTREFPAELRNIATSVALESDQAPSRTDLLVAILSALDRDLFLAAGRGLGPFRARLKAGDLLLGSAVANDAGEEGLANGIDDAGRLVVRLSSGQNATWSSGEVHLLRPAR